MRFILHFMIFELYENKIYSNLIGNKIIINNIIQIIYNEIYTTNPLTSTIVDPLGSTDHLLETIGLSHYCGDDDQTM